MGDHTNDSTIYELIRSRPITPARVVKVNAGGREKNSEHAPQINSPTSPKYSSGCDENEENYGLKILGCTKPGITERPVSAACRLDPPEEGNEPWQATEEDGNILEISDNFQKLKIARNQSTVCRGAGSPSNPAAANHASLKIPPTTGITIQSLSGNAVLFIPESHRSTRGNGNPDTSAVSSENEIRVHPTILKKSKLAKSRRKRRICHGVPSNTGGMLYKSLPEEGEGEEVVDDSDITSDVGGSDEDYSAPCRQISTLFDAFEMIRPETASSEILAHAELAAEKEQIIKKLMKGLNVEYDENWYFGSSEEKDTDDAAESAKTRLLQLTKMFYLRTEQSSAQGLLYTHTLMLAGLHNRLEDFVLLPVPPGFYIKTRITRVKKGISGRLNPIYFMHLEREGPGDRKCLLLVAKKTTKHFRGVGYLLSTDPAELTSSSEYCVGKVSSNFIGTEFTLYAGRPICSHVPMEKGALTALPQDNRFQEELTSVLYDPNVLGFKGPRKIKVIIPRMINTLEREIIKPRISEESMIYQYQNEDDGPILSLRNKDPIWSRDTHSYILNFSGRVSTASVKNFQIVCEENEDLVLFQFGRASKNTFSLDFQYPFCPLQAFAIALTSFDSKLACE